MVQPQYNKGDTMSKEIKDQVITTLKIAKTRITTILSTPKE